VSSNTTLSAEPLAFALDHAGVMSERGYGGVVLDRLAKQAVDLLAVDESCIFVRDQADSSMVILAAAQGPAADMIGKRMSVESARSATHGAAMRLCWDGEFQGALAVSSATGPDFVSSEHSAVLQSIGEVAAAAIFHRQARGSVVADIRAPIRALANALDRRDGYTARHSQHVVATTCEIGLRLGFDSAALAELEAAALLHDIGKIYVPDEILGKPGPLTAEEFAVMARHPVLGAEILTRIPDLEVVASIVRYHHERWDGGGYPDGLSAGCIPLGSRIIAVCDAHDAMTSDRPYRTALSPETALAELRSGSGWQFDPGVVAQAEIVIGHLGDS
jgi:putative nucleotidyltransferase with HDIG domain